jgi:hypothetical protein
MRESKIMMPPDAITTRIDGWVGRPDQCPAAIAELIARFMPRPSGDTVAKIRARMLARQKKVLGDD